jgi:hypothetical protein
MDTDEGQVQPAEVVEERALRPSLLSLLVAEGVASEDELRVVAAEGMGAGVRLGEAVLRRGWVDEEGLARLLARQWSLDFVEPGSIDDDVAGAGLISPERASELRAFCWRSRDGSLRALVSNPSTELLNQLRGELGETRFAVSTEPELERLLARAESAAGDSIPDQRSEAAAALVAELEAATRRLQQLHARAAAAIEAQHRTLDELHALTAEVEHLRDARSRDETRIREAEDECRRERERHQILVTQLAGLLGSHTGEHLDVSSTP